MSTPAYLIIALLVVLEIVVGYYMGVTVDNEGILSILLLGAGPILAIFTGILIHDYYADEGSKLFALWLTSFLGILFQGAGYSYVVWPRLFAGKDDSQAQ